MAKLRGMGIADTHPICEKLVQECCEAGLKAKLMQDGPAMKWSKLISNLLSNAASAIFNMTPAEVFADPDAFKLEIRQLKETLAVMKGLGIAILSTSKGVMTDKDARKANVGGEVLAYIW